MPAHQSDRSWRLNVVNACVAKRSGFRHLAHDLRNYCQAFVSGPDEQFNVVASDAGANVRKGIP